MSANSSKTTTDLQEIRQWAEKRGAKPAKVKSAGNDEEGEGLLRLDFPGYSGGDTLKKIDWDEWYGIFQEKNLAFLYQEKTSGGKESRFFKLVSKKDN